MTAPTLCLVHGSWQRGSCWAGVVAELERRGLHSIAPDLPSDRPDAGLDAYADQVVRSCAAVTGPLVLVGHSLGGLVIPVVAQRRPVALLVFLCAALPEPGRSLTEQRATTDPDMLTAAWRTHYLPRQVVLPDGRTTRPTEVAREALFHDCPATAADAAVAALRTQNPDPLREPSPLTAWPEVDRAVILCTDDRVISPDWSRRTARRLGVRARELPGGHSPFLARPHALADELVELAAAHGLLHSVRRGKLGHRAPL